MKNIEEHQEKERKRDKKGFMITMAKGPQER